MSNPIVIAFVPGTTASVLEQEVNGEKRPTWPNVLSLDPFTVTGDKKALEDDATADATSLVQEYPIPLHHVPCYRSLIDHLSDKQNYPSLTVAYPTDTIGENPDQLFFMLPYDWRVDNRTSAAKVAALLDLLDTKIYPDTDYDLFIVSHSNGGLVSRYMVEKLAPNTNPRWYGRLQKLITLATPHLGSPLAWPPIVGQQLNYLEFPDAVRFVSAVVDNSMFPSTTQLLPPATDPFMSGPGNTIENIYAPSAKLAESMQKYGVCQQNMTAAKELQDALDLSKMAKTPVPYVFMYGTELGTLANTGTKKAFTYDPDGQTTYATFIASDAKGNGEGDSVVPSHSGSAGSPAIVTTQAFPQYNHGQMGGCDMDNHPDAINAMLKICGITSAKANKTAHAAE